MKCQGTSRERHSSPHSPCPLSAPRTPTAAAPPALGALGGHCCVGQFQLFLSSARLRDAVHGIHGNADTGRCLFTTSRGGERIIEQYCQLIKQTLDTYYNADSDTLSGILQVYIYLNPERNDLRHTGIHKCDIYMVKLSFVMKESDASRSKAESPCKLPGYSESIQQRTELKYVT